MDVTLQRILVPVDGSDASRRALFLAVKLARLAGARLTLLEVIEDFGPLPGYYEAPPPGVDRVAWVAEQRLEALHPDLELDGIDWDRRVESGDPADRICAVAEEGAYDLIVVGSHGRSALGRFLVGSVSDRVVHHAPCSVTVVRGPVAGKG